MNKEKIDNLRNNNLILSSLYNGNNDSKKVEIVLDSKNEKELQIAESIITFMSDSIELMSNLDSLIVSDEDFDKSLSINLFVNIICALREDDKEEIKRIFIYEYRSRVCS